jgi:hypothetical protein
MKKKKPIWGKKLEGHCWDSAKDDSGLMVAMKEGWSKVNWMNYIS